MGLAPMAHPPEGFTSRPALTSHQWPQNHYGRPHGFHQFVRCSMIGDFSRFYPQGARREIVKLRPQLKQQLLGGADIPQCGDLVKRHLIRAEQ